MFVCVCARERVVKAAVYFATSCSKKKLGRVRDRNWTIFCVWQRFRAWISILKNKKERKNRWCVVVSETQWVVLILVTCNLQQQPNPRKSILICTHEFFSIIPSERGWKMFLRVGRRRFHIPRLDSCARFLTHLILFFSVFLFSTVDF